MRRWLGVVGIAAFSSSLTYAVLSSNLFFIIVSILGLVISAFYISPQNQNNDIEPISEEEYQILEMLRRGYSKRRIARTLGISHTTLYRKLKVLQEKGLITSETVSREVST